MEAKKRIIFDEFFRFFSALELVKDREEQALNHYIIPMEEPVKRFVENLPYPLTRGAQKKVLNEIRQDFFRYNGNEPPFTGRRWFGKDDCSNDSDVCCTSARLPSGVDGSDRGTCRTALPELCETPFPTWE